MTIPWSRSSVNSIPQYIRTKNCNILQPSCRIDHKSWSLSPRRPPYCMTGDVPSSPHCLNRPTVIGEKWHGDSRAGSGGFEFPFVKYLTGRETAFPTVYHFLSRMRKYIPITMPNYLVDIARQGNGAHCGTKQCALNYISTELIRTFIQ